MNKRIIIIINMIKYILKINQKKERKQNQFQNNNIKNKMMKLLLLKKIKKEAYLWKKKINKNFKMKFLTPKNCKRKKVNNKSIKNKNFKFKTNKSKRNNSIMNLKMISKVLNLITI